MSESRLDGERLSYQAPEIRSLGTIAEITAAGVGGFNMDSSSGYSSDQGHGGPGS